MAQSNRIASKSGVNHHVMQPVTTTPSEDELFDRLVAEEHTIGIMVDISSGHNDRKLLVNYKQFEGSAQYEAALHRRVTRLASGRRGHDGLRWDSEEIVVYTQPTSIRSRSVCLIKANVPITTGNKGECGWKDYRCHEHRKFFRVLFIFDLTPIPHAQRTAFNCKNRDCDELLNGALDYYDRRAWDQAEKKGNEWNWPKDEMDIHWLWLRVSRGFTSAADNRFNEDIAAAEALLAFALDQ